MDRVRVNELSTKLIEFDVLDEDGEGVPAVNLTLAQLTLYDMDTASTRTSPDVSILNGRDAVDVLNDNDVTISVLGHVVWTMQPDDNAIITSRRQLERHRAQFLFTWTGGEFRQEIEIEVVNLRLAPRAQ